jgi:hypothetical protein
MSSRSNTLSAGRRAQASERRRSRTGLPYLSEKQIQAYLAAREVLRRIVHTSPLVMPPPNGGADDRDRTRTHARQGRRSSL